ncbi:putative polysaccharide biosynthesis protein [Virgibacillus ndiopensis]|uniref:putative polysaccharide biosynthesis protein n=1 Tax=Virgibacillus ndiopensis TaxID=2004408 RepID=UPI000C070AB8|nr:polysaccharide biosynthesis protein [Virgibacillus ndiopensis]
MSNFVKGTMLLTGATFLSKFLGMIFVIPFNALVGPNGGALYQIAYVPYNIVLSISTVGVPLAVAKFVSKYNSLGDYKTGMRMYRAGISLMLVTGFIAFLVLFFAAEPIAQFTIPDKSNITIEDTKMVIRMVSFALLIIPAMSITRGFFQGYQSMGPTAISQVVEQIVRIVFLLGSTFIIIVILDGAIPTAVGFATFAAFVGGLASGVVLWQYWRKRKPNIEKQIAQQRESHDIPMKKLFIEILSYAGPFIVVGIATSLYQLVDQFTFGRAMTAIGKGEIWELVLSTINLYSHKLVIIPVTLATGLSLAILPVLTNSFTQNNRPVLFQQINQALQIVMVLVTPAAIGLSMLSNVAYGSLYGEMHQIDITGPLLGWYAPVGLLFALFTVSSSILQGINQQRFTVISLSAGLLTKILFNILLIHTFGGKGAIFGTALAVAIAVGLNLWRIRTSIQFSFKQLFKRTLLILIFTLIMAITIAIVKAIFGLFIPYETERWAAIIMLFFGVTLGGGVYLWLGYHSTLLERVLGNRIQILDRIFRR